jgi:hypothetical protein
MPNNPVGNAEEKEVLLVDKDQSNSHLYVKTGVATRKRPSPTNIVSNLSSTSSLDLSHLHDPLIKETSVESLKHEQLRQMQKSSSVYSEAGPDELRSLETIGKTKSQQVVEDQVVMLRRMLTISLGVALLLSLALATTYARIPQSIQQEEMLGLHAKYSKRWMQDSGDFVLHEDIVVAPNKDSPTHNSSSISGKVSLSLRQLDQLNLLVTVANIGPGAADAIVPDGPIIPHGPPVQLWDELQRMGDLGTADATIIAALADGASMASDVIQDPTNPLVYTKCFVRTRTQNIAPTP